MKKHYLKLIFICSLFLMSNSAFAQGKDYDFTKAIGEMTDFFEKLITKANSLGATLDKTKFYSLSADMLYNLHEVKQSKINLLTAISKVSINKDDIQKKVQKLKSRIEDLQNTLEYNRDLIRGLNIDGFDAIKLSASLNSDLTQKGLIIGDMLRDIDELSLDPVIYKKNKDKLIENLKKGIALLDSSIEKLDKFNASLRK